MKIHPVGAVLFYADGQTDMTKLIVTFRNFANAHEICISRRQTCVSATLSSKNPENEPKTPR